MIDLAWLLLPAVAASGWYIGRKQQHNAKSSLPNFHQNYLVGLNYLLNEQPDKAVDIFIKMLEVDSDTVETHLALGNLFRRRGEVARAIRIHQNVIARPQLDKRQRCQALRELGLDYMRAGVLDRAERLFSELVEAGEETESSLQSLLHIYEQQKDWDQAIQAAEKLSAMAGKNMKPVIAHYHCELAEKAHYPDHYEKALRLIKRALNIDSNCVRASLMLGQLETKAGQYRNAIRALKQVKEQDADFIAETVEPLCQCYEQLGEQQQLIDYLQSSLQEYPRIVIVLTLADYLRRQQNNLVAIEFIAEQIRRYPSLRGLRRLIELYLSNSDGHTKDKLSILCDLTDKLLMGKPKYRCKVCGFSGQVIYWQCPGCKHWSTVKPIHGLEGD